MKAARERLRVQASNDRISSEMKKLILGFAGAAALLTTNALADGMANPKAACCEASRPWTGFYIGAGAGSGAVVHDLSINAPGVNILSFDGIGGEGIFGTVIVGYDRKLTSSIVAGIFFDYDFSGISTDLSVAGGLFSASLDHEHSWSVGGRLGVLSSPSTLWYGTIGYTEAKFDLSSTIGSLDLPDFKGYFVGGGVESQLHGGWAIRAEYRYTQFDSETVARLGPVNIDLEPSMHTGRIALTYKWAREEAVRVPMK